MNIVTLGTVKSQKSADVILGKLAKLKVGGGKTCFHTDLCPRTDEIRINFLPDMYRRERPTHGLPNTDILTGFVLALTK